MVTRSSFERIARYGDGLKVLRSGFEQKLLAAAVINFNQSTKLLNEYVDRLLDLKNSGCDIILVKFDKYHYKESLEVVRGAVKQFCAGAVAVANVETFQQLENIAEAGVKNVILHESCACSKVLKMRKFCRSKNVSCQLSVLGSQRDRQQRFNQLCAGCSTILVKDPEETSTTDLDENGSFSSEEVYRDYKHYHYHRQEYYGMSGNQQGFRQIRKISAAISEDLKSVSAWQGVKQLHYEVEQGRIRFEEGPSV